MSDTEGLTRWAVALVATIIGLFLTLVVLPAYLDWDAAKIDACIAQGGTEESCGWR